MYGLQQEVDQVSDVKWYLLGTRLVRGSDPFRYAQAGSYLKGNYPAYAHLEGELPRDAEGRIIWGEEQTEVCRQELVADLIRQTWSDIRSEGESHLLMGWPVVDVAPGQYFWLREKV